MRGLIPLLQRLDDSRRVCDLYIGEGHPHLSGLARDLPGTRMVVVDELLADELTAVAASIDHDSVAELLSHTWAAHSAARAAGSMYQFDPAGSRVLVDAARTVQGAAVTALRELLGVAHVGGFADPASAVIDQAARIREAAADRRELAQAVGA